MENMFQRSLLKIVVLALFLLSAACQQPVFKSTAVTPSVLRDVPAMRFNYRFETDVPPPAAENPAAVERNQAVQSDFDQNRPQDFLDKTVASPNNQRVLAVYHSVSDLQSEFRLDMYSPDGKLLKRMTHEGMAVHFADAIVWAPDSSAAAFVAMARLGNPDEPSVDPEKKLVPDATPKTEEGAANSNVETPAADQPVAAPTAPVGDQPSPVLTFRSEQIYLCDANGGDLKPLTQSEGLIHFYLVWAPDSSAIAALASKVNEWKIWKYQADQNGQVFRPAGRPRIVEKNGRQRLLDDYPTQVHPVWSPDSAKVAAAFDKQIRIYDAIGNAPTQAAILLRNQLLISSKAYDEAKRQEMGDNSDADSTAPANQPVNKPANANANIAAANLPAGVLPDETTLVSFNPIVDLRWTEDAMLYLETAFVREFIDSANNVRSNSRWHRLIFSAQAVALGTQPQ